MSLDNWVTEPEAARRLGISDRQLRTWAAQGKRPERRYRPRPGKKAEAVYNPRDVEELTAARPVVISTEVPAVPASTRQTPTSIAPWAVLTPYLERLTKAVEPRLEPPPPVVPWVTMADAAQIAGLSENLLRNLVRAGKLGCLRDRQGWKVRRGDLEHLEASKLHAV